MEIFRQERTFSLMEAGEKFVITQKNKDGSVKIRIYPKNATLDNIKNNRVAFTRATLEKKQADRQLTMYCYGIWDYSIKPGYKRQPKWSEPLSKDDLNKELKDIKERMGENDELYIYKKYGVSEQGQLAINAKVKHGNKLENIYLLRVDLL